MKIYSHQNSKYRLTLLRPILATCGVVSVFAGCSRPPISASKTDTSRSILNPSPSAKPNERTSSEEDSNFRPSSAVSSKSQDFSGKWLIDLSKMDIGTGKTAEEVRATAPTTFILLEKDGSYTDTVAGMVAFKGRYQVKGKSVHFTITSTSSPATTANNGTLSSDESLLTFGSGKTRTVYKKIQ